MNLTESIRRYYEQLQPKYITWDFYEKYIDIEPPFGQLGLPVFLRTYSRHIESEKRREKWLECVLRNVEFSICLDGVTSYDELKKEAEELFDYIFNLRTFPSGRALWVAGSKQTEVDPSSIWNCTFRTIDSLSAFSEIFYWLLIGAGCGFSVEEEYVNQLPSFFNNEDKPIQHVNEDVWIEGYKDTLLCLDDFNQELTLTKEHLLIDDAAYLKTLNLPYLKPNVTIVVGDSKEGWSNALRTYLTLLTVSEPFQITFDYKYVRPKGVPLKTFGGRASGCGNLIDLFNSINDTITNRKLTSVDCLDIVCIVGRAVVSGGVRRTALICLGGNEDDAFKTAKYDLWTDPAKQKYTTYRTMSNNSIAAKAECPTREQLKESFDVIKSNGEPAFWIVGNAQKYDEQILGTNPCGEASLRNRQSCNLTTNNVAAFIKYDSDNSAYLDEEAWRKSLYLSTRIGTRVTLLQQWHPEWDKVQKSQRLLGVSMTGLMDAVDLLGWNDEQLQDFFVRSRLYVREVADQYSDALGIERSARISLFKPEGSVSQLPTVSSGIHRAYSPHYIRRVRFSSIDPLATALLDIVGADNVKPENGQGNIYYTGWKKRYIEFQNFFRKLVKKPLLSLVEKTSIYANDVNTWVFTFPIETAAKIRAIDESAISQLERYLLAQTSYTADGHNTSVTVTVAPEEWDEVEQWVYDNWSDIIGVSFLPKFDPEKETYPQMPYEPCQKDKYDELYELLPTFNENQLISLISKYEDNYDEYGILEDACASGSCPLR